MDSEKDGQPSFDHILDCAARISMTALDILAFARNFMKGEKPEESHLIVYNDFHSGNQVTSFFFALKSWLV
jgi:hypothetical protein